MRGELLRLESPNGTGEDILMWAITSAESPKTATVVEVNMVIMLVGRIVPDEVILNDNNFKEGNWHLL